MSITTTLNTELTKAEAAADRAAEKAARLRAESAQLEDERAEARRVATHEWHVERKANFRRDFGMAKINAAWSAFVDTVRDGGDTVAAWREYRVARRVVSAESGTIRRYFNQIEDAKVDAIRAEQRWLNTEAGLLDTARERGREWSERLAEWNRRRAAHTGEPTEPTDHPRQVPPLGLSKSGERLAERNPIDPRLGESYAKAIDAAMATIEDDAVTAHKAQRRSDLDARLTEAVR